MGYRTHKPDQRTDDLCHRAADMLKRAGFEFHCASMKTEACYYCWPGKKSLLRVAAHSKKERPPGLSHVAAKVTFNGTCLSEPGFMRVADHKVETMVALAIGRYFLKARETET